MRNAIVRLIKSIATSKLFFDFFYKKNRAIPVVMYHGISEYNAITPELLEQQFAWISKNFTSYFVSQIHEANARPNTKPIILTFDDGLRNSAKYVEPLLKKYHLKATFYIVSGLLSGRDFLWNHEFLIRLESLPLGLRKDVFGAASIEAKRFVENLKKQPHDEVQMLLKKLRELTANLVYTDEQLSKHLIMSAEEVAKLDGTLIEIGAHTDSHPILNNLPIKNAINEIKTSKLKLEELTGKKVHSFCYPNGDYNKELDQLVGNVFDFVVTTKSDLMNSELYSYTEIPRISSFANLVDFKFNLIKPMRYEVA